MPKKLKKQQAPYRLDKEEQALSDSFDRGEWKTVSNLEEEIALAKCAGANYLRKNTRVNIRMSSSDLERIKNIAAFEGLPYQTLIASVLHKFSAGHLDLQAPE